MHAILLISNICLKHAVVVVETYHYLSFLIKLDHCFSASVFSYSPKSSSDQILWLCGLYHHLVLPLDFHVILFYGGCFVIF